MSVAPADVTFVKTAQQLLDAVSTGKRDIVVKAHLDLTELPTDDFGSVLTLLPSTRSVRVSLPDLDFTIHVIHVTMVWVNLAPGSAGTSVVFRVSAFWYPSNCST